MSQAEAPYVEVAAEDPSWPLLIHAEHAEDPNWKHGAGELLGVAILHYNASIDALRSGDVPSALKSAERAVELMPYCPPLLEYAAALTIQHGDFELASKVIGTAEALGLTNQFAGYRAELGRRTDAWNEAIENPASIGARVASNADSVGYRDLLLLQSSGTVEIDVPLRRQLEKYGLASPTNEKPKIWSWALLIIVAGLSVVAGGAIGASTWPLADNLPASNSAVRSEGSGSRSPEVERSRPSYDRTAVLGAIADGDVALAAEEIAQLRSSGPGADELGILEALLSDRLVERARDAWRRTDYNEVVRLLKPLLSMQRIARPEGLYYLGIAAEASSEDSLALEALARFLRQEIDLQAPHFRAQAAYSAARLAKGSDAHKYAQIVSTEYPATIYNNSRIRRLLADGSE